MNRVGHVHTCVRCGAAITCERPECAAPSLRLTRCASSCGQVYPYPASTGRYTAIPREVFHFKTEVR